MTSALALIHAIDQHIINPIIIFLFAAAVLVFMYGVFEYFKDGGSEAARTTGRNHILASIVGMFVMISVFGIINIVLRTVGADSTSTGVHEVTGK